MNGINKNAISSEKLQEFEILFDDPKAVYTSGDEITGKIRIMLKEPMKMHMVQLRVTGTTRVTLADPKPQNFLKRQLSKTWEKREPKNDKQPEQKQEKSQKKKKEQAQDVQGVIVGKNGLVAIAVPTNGVVQNGTVVAPRSPSPCVGRFHEMISLDKTIDLLERRPGQEMPHDFALPTGLNSLPFSFLLPKKPLPASFESAFASVRYTCQATICKPWKHDHVTKKAFTVLPPTDNASCIVALDPKSSTEAAATSGYCCRLATPANFPSLSNRLSVDETTSTQACCTTGKITCDASIPKQVYNIGEPITISAKLTNNSRLNVDEVKFALVQNITCKGRDSGGKIERSSVYTRTFWHETKSSTTNKKAKKKRNSPDNVFEANCRIPTMSPSMEIDSNVYNHYKPNDQSTLDRRVLGGLMMLRVSYYALVQLKVGKKLDYLTVKLPFVLVGAPFVTYAQQEYDHKSPSSESFELSECILGAVDIRDENDKEYVIGAQKYVPIYPILRVDSKTSA